MSRAFEQSLPAPLSQKTQSGERRDGEAKSAQRANQSGKAGDAQSYLRGAQQLKNLLPSRSGDNRRAGDSSQKLPEGAAENIARALGPGSANRPETRRLLADLQRQAKGRDGRVDEEVIRRLHAELNRLAVETAQTEKHRNPSDLKYDDASRLPPAYRERIRKYYEKLPEAR